MRLRVVHLLLLGSMVLPGCIQRYRAPDGPTDIETPYSALAVYREVTPPVADGEPLPTAAMRVVAKGETVFADVALINGPEHAGITETWAGTLALIQVHQAALVVVIADEPGVVAVCAELATVAARLTRAVRATDGPMYPLKASAVDGASADLLRGVPLVCPEKPVPDGN